MLFIGITTSVNNKAVMVKTAPKSRKAAAAASKRKNTVAKKAAVISGGNLCKCYDVV